MDTHELMQLTDWTHKSQPQTTRGTRSLVASKLAFYPPFLPPDAIDFYAKCVCVCVSAFVVVMPNRVGVQIVY